jgi:hypothetical protein
MGLGANVAGDDGKALRAGFSGAGRRRWDGVLRCAGRLDAATGSIAIDDARFRLVSAAPQVDVRLQALAPADPALRHLWRCAVLADSLFDPHVDDAISAFVAAGAIEQDHPDLPALRAVADALSLTDGDRLQAVAALPEPWVSLWRAGRDGPERVIAVGIVTPLFDGVTVAVNVLESFADRWSLAVEFAPEGASPHPWEAPSARRASLVWWAQDDRGNRYLATAYGFGGNAKTGSGTVTFDAPIHPRARWIELQPTAETARAVIRVPLD